MSNKFLIINNFFNRRASQVALREPHAVLTDYQCYVTLVSELSKGRVSGEYGRSCQQSQSVQSQAHGKQTGSG